MQLTIADVSMQTCSRANGREDLASPHAVLVGVRKRAVRDVSKEHDTVMEQVAVLCANGVCCCCGQLKGM